MKSIRIIVISIISLIVAISVILYSSVWLWPELWGSRKLGKGLYLLSWDNDTKIVVYGNTLIGNTCYGGSYIIPSDSIGLTGEFVLDAVPTKEYVIVMSNLYTMNKKKYYIISRLFEAADTINVALINNYVHPYGDYISFSKQCDSLGIDIPAYWK